MIFLEAVFLTSVLCFAKLLLMRFGCSFFEKLQSFLGQAGDKVAQNIALADVKLATLIIHGHC